MWTEYTVYTSQSDFHTRVCNKCMTDHLHIYFWHLVYIIIKLDFLSPDFEPIKQEQTAAKDPALWRQLCVSNSEGQWVDNIGYLVLLSVLGRWGLPAAGRALGSALVLPPDRTTRLVSDTLNLSGVAWPREAMEDEQGKGPIYYNTVWT